ncbi:MAG: DUF3196 family protein [Bulleidia sp.]
MNYYEQIRQDIELALQKQELEEAAFLIRKEREMPYIPAAFEAFLDQAERELSANRRTSKKESFSNEQLLHMLSGNAERQMAAAAALCERNLRAYVPVIADWLQRDPHPQAAALLIDALAEQAVPAEFTYEHNDMTYTFYADAVTPVASQSGVRKALHLVESALARNPGLRDMAHSRLIHEAFLLLPLMIEEEEAETFALESIKEVCTLMDDCETYGQAKKTIETLRGGGRLM